MRRIRHSFRGIGARSVVALSCVAALVPFPLYSFTEGLGQAGASRPSGFVAEATRFLGGVVRDLVGGAGSSLFLVAAAAAYGAIHALGPGHQKTLVAGHLVGEGGGIVEAARSALAASAGHAVSVVALFALLAAAGSAFGASDVARSGDVVSRASGVALAAVSLAMLVRRSLSLARLFRRGVIAVLALSAGMWVILFAVALVSLGARERGMKVASLRAHRARERVRAAFAVAGGAVVFAFALTLAL